MPFDSEGLLRRFARGAPLPLRLIVGYGFMAHGVAKLARGPEAFATALAGIGVPSAHWMAWATIGIELLGGLAILLGIYIRLASLPLAVVLLVAVFAVHLPYGFSSIKLQAVTEAGAQFGPPGYEVALLYLACLLALCLSGAGPLAIGNGNRKRSGVAEDVFVAQFTGSRCRLLPLFQQADDSRMEIDGYIELGEVLVARRRQRIIGHAQLIACPAEWEIKSLAVIASERGKGVGRTLVRSALDRAFAAGALRVLVATAAGATGNLGFYQRLGFRMERVLRNVFTVERGYPQLKPEEGALADEVWFSISAEEWQTLR